MKRDRAKKMAWCSKSREKGPARVFVESCMWPLMSVPIVSAIEAFERELCCQFGIHSLPLNGLHRPGAAPA